MAYFCVFGCQTKVFLFLQILFVTVVLIDKQTLFLIWLYPQKLRVAKFTSMLGQSYGLQKMKLTQKEDLLERKYFTGSMPLHTPTTILRLRS